MNKLSAAIRVKKIAIFISIMLCLSITQLYGQAHVAYIEVDSTFLKQSKDNYFEINGIDVSKPKSIITIPINEYGFDTIRYGYFDKKHVNHAIMKLKEDVRYRLNSNSCSFYTIRPAENPLQGMVQFTIDSPDITSYLAGVGNLDYRKLSSQQKDEFYYTPPSAMCPFAARSIEIKTMDEETINEFKYHFLHGELLGVKYHADDNSFKLTLSGYIRDKSDYKYYYEYEK